MKWLQDRCSFSSLTHNRLKLEETFVLIVVNWMYLDILIIIYLCMSSKAKCTNACCSSNSENPKSNCMTLKNFNRFNTTIWIIFTVFSVDRAIIAIIRIADKIFSLKNIWYYFSNHPTWTSSPDVRQLKRLNSSLDRPPLPSRSIWLYMSVSIPLNLADSLTFFVPSGVFWTST